MSKDRDSIKIAKLVKILSGDKKIDQIANVIDKISVKESEQLRPIVPVSEWVNDDYYIGLMMLILFIISINYTYLDQ